MDAQVMELIGYDKSFNKVAYIPFINLQWKRRYYTFGSFSFQILAEDYDPNIKYVHSAQRPELGIIERMETQQTIKGHFVQLSGRFIESVFNRQLTFPKIEGDYDVGTIYTIITYSDYKPDLYTFRKGTITNSSTDLSFKWDKEELGDAIYESLKSLELSMRVTFDPDTKRLTFNIWKGLDRTQSQTKNGYAVFSDESPMVSSFSYIEDESDYKNAAMVLYEEPQEDAAEDAEPVILRQNVTVGSTSTYGRRWIAVDADYEDTDETRRQQGIEGLQDSPLVQEAKIDVIQVGLFYLTDYDIGDKCQLVSARYKKDFSARITSVDEVWKQGKHTVKLGFGEQTQTKYRKLRRYVRRHGKMHRFGWW